MRTQPGVLRTAMLLLALAAMMLTSGCAARRGPRRLVDDEAIKVTTRTTYYQVDLLDPRTLVRAMWDQGISNRSGVVGQTSTQFKWQMAFEPEGPARCAVNNVQVTGELRITLPRWSPPTGTSPERRSWWQAYLSGVTAHENTHVSILVDYFREMVNKLEKMTGTDCKTLNEMATQALNSGKAAMDERQREFDRSDGSVPIGYPPP